MVTYSNIQRHLPSNDFTALNKITYAINQYLNKEISAENLWKVYWNIRDNNRSLTQFLKENEIAGPHDTFMENLDMYDASENARRKYGYVDNDVVIKVSRDFLAALEEFDRRLSK